MEPVAAAGPPPAIRMGRRAQHDGQILGSDQTHVFMAYDQIHISISVPEGTGSALAALTIQDQGTNQQVWQEQRSFAAGDSLLTFDLGPGRLAPGDYIAVVTVDDRTSAQQTFKVSSR